MKKEIKKIKKDKRMEEKIQEKTMELLRETKSNLIILRDFMNYDDFYYNRITEALEIVKVTIDEYDTELKDKQ